MIVAAVADSYKGDCCSDIIKDDILVHGRGDEHDDRLRAVLTRLYKYGIRLRRKTCKLGKQVVVWFGHIYTKQGMSPDPAKVEHIWAWEPPRDKSEVKSFLQTVLSICRATTGDHM